jgi:hypothetical protein
MRASKVVQFLLCSVRLSEPRLTELRPQPKIDAHPGYPKDVMDAAMIQTRLTQAILVANTGPSVEVGENFVHAGRVTVEFAPDRLTIRDRMGRFMNPGSIALLVARFDEPDFEDKVGRFLEKKGVGLPARWAG